MIYLFPHSGLANRIRAIVSGIHLAEVLKQEFTIFWKKDSSLGSEFEDIFEFNERFIIKNHTFFARLLDFGKNKYRSKRLLYKFFSIGFVLFDTDFPKYIWSRGSVILDLKILPENFNNIYISTCNEFYFDRKYLDYLRPTKSIENVVNNVTSNFSSKTIGVHIRRTDHLISTNESPLELFIQKMRKELDLDSESNFFLATDSWDVENDIKMHFPNKILTYNKVYSRASVQGVKDAMVDLYSLSRTCKIYGSHSSSYSDIAARIGDIPLEVIGK